MITLTKVNLWDGFVGDCSPKLQDYLKTDCIFTDWLASRGEIKPDGTTGALIVVCQLAGFIEKEKGKATLRRYLEHLGKNRNPGKLPTQEVNGKRYALLCSSAGLLKDASFYYVREDLYKDAMSFIWGSLDPWKVKAVKNKWLVYPGLLFSTATKAEWTVDFNRIAVLPDIFNAVEAEVKRLILPEINKEGAWPQLREEVITKEMNLSDGLAIRFVDEDIPYRCSNKEELASFVAKTPLKAYTIRQHFVKGLCVELPRTFLNAVLRYCTKDGKRLGLTPETKVEDIFGNPHRLSDLDMIMFESVFKMGAAYRDQFGKDGFAAWVEHVKKETPSFYVCVKQHRKKENRLTAQPYQTMVEPTKEQFQKLWEARNILEDYESLPGIAHHLGASLGKAVRLFPKLAATLYCKSEAAASRHNALWGLLKGQIPLGKESGYLFVATDPVAIIQGMVGADITGCLKANEVCAPHEREGRTLIVRHPHPNQNLVVADNRHVLSPAMGSDVIWASAHDLMAVVLKMDFDGDHLQVITNETLIELAEQTNGKYGTRPVVWDSPKGAKELCSLLTSARSPWSKCRNPGLGSIRTPSPGCGMPCRMSGSTTLGLLPCLLLASTSSTRILTPARAAGIPQNWGTGSWGPSLWLTPPRQRLAPSRRARTTLRRGLPSRSPKEGTVSRTTRATSMPGTSSFYLRQSWTTSMSRRRTSCPVGSLPTGSSRRATPVL